jgi:UDP-glucose 4-epimerase
VILITGGLGFIGLHTARAMLDAGESVVLTRYRSARVPDFLEKEVGKRVFIEPVDVNSPYLIMDAIRKHKVTAICDLFVPRRGTLPPGEDYRVKMEGFLHVLEAARLCDVPRLSHASSLAVYGSVREGPHHEDMPLPTTSRSETEAFKKAEEVLGNYYASETGLDIVFLRIGNVYGPLYDRENRVNTRMIRAAMNGTPVSWDGIPGGTPYAENSEDALYVKDGGRAIAMLTMARNLSSRAYNIGGGRSVTYQELADAVKRIYPSAQIDLAPGKSPHARASGGMDISRIKQDVGWEPEYDIDRGVGEWIDWLKTHPV